MLLYQGVLLMLQLKILKKRITLQTSYSNVTFMKLLEIVLYIYL